MDVSALEQAGLTPGEIRVYLALLKAGVSRTGPLCAQAGVSSSKVYKILERLEKKGLTGHVLKGKVRHFSALPLNRLLELIDEKSQNLQTDREKIVRLLPFLESEREKASAHPEAAVFEGYRAVTNLIRSMLDELRPGGSYRVMGAGYGEIPSLREFFYAHHKRRAARKIRVQMLANADEKGTLVKTTLTLSEIRYLPPHLITPLTIYLYGKKVILVLWTREPKGFLIESEEAVSSFEKYFETFWKMAKA